MTLGVRAVVLCLGIGFGSGNASCPLLKSTNVVYSKASGVGGASKIWVEDFLYWWQTQGDSRISYQGLTSADIQNCELSKFAGLRVFINPGA
jgi:hypothetical protein